MTRNDLAGTATLGLRVNAAQFSLLVAVNALVGGVVGQQQTVLPLLAADDFGLTGYTVIFTYIAAFGITKAGSNYAAGILLGLTLSALLVKETRGHAALEQHHRTPRLPSLRSGTTHSSRDIFALSTWREPALASASQAGLVNNLNFGLAWGLFPLLFATADLSLGQISLLFALYPGVWGVGQLATGALSDRYGRKRLITAGMGLQSAALAVIALAGTFPGWAVGTILLGAGTAMVYPTLLAAIGDVAEPAWRGRAVGIYRLWRDLGYAFGAVIGGIMADVAGLHAAVWAAAALSAAAALVVALRMYETHPTAR